MDTKNLRRTGYILYKKLYALLLPSIMCTAALTLNEFADSILMSNLLGSRALAVINYCYCIVCAYAAAAYICGYGGSIIYARLAGEKKTEQARTVYAKSLTLAMIVSAVILVLGLAGRKEIAAFICRDPALRHAVRFEPAFNDLQHNLNVKLTICNIICNIIQLRAV